LHEIIGVPCFGAYGAHNRIIGSRGLDVTVPGFDGTLYHIHKNPYFWISIGAATLRGVTLGSPDVTNIKKRTGR